MATETKSEEHWVPKSPLEFEVAKRIGKNVRMLRLTWRNWTQDLFAIIVMGINLEDLEKIEKGELIPSLDSGSRLTLLTNTSPKVFLETDMFPEVNLNATS
ncbi:MAG TPA: hypothetical protein ENI23_17315 [bacterium]|nr:hypothetical protein [bacterium]